MITIFTCPKDFDNPHTRKIQINAIESWKKLVPTPEIMLLGNDNGVREVAQNYDLIHIPKIKINENGVPYVNSIFEFAQTNAKNNIMCYINADIILFSKFLNNISEIIKEFPEFLCIGQRTDLNIEYEIDFKNKDWEIRLTRKINLYGQLHPPTGIDYFVFTKNLFNTISPFLIGRGYYDSWLVWRAFSLKVPIIDLTEVNTVVHQNHDYNFLKNDLKNETRTNLKVHWEKPPLIMFHNNEKLAGSWIHNFDIRECTYQKSKNGIKKKWRFFNINPLFFSIKLFFEGYKGLNEFIKKIPLISIIINPKNLPKPITNRLFYNQRKS